MPLSRRQIREKVFQAAFAWAFSTDEPDAVYDRLLANEVKSLMAAGDQDADFKADARFMKRLYYGLVEHRDAVVQLVDEKLENWDFQRLALSDQLIIALGYTEFLDCPEVPTRVTINEYIELAKRFSTDKSSGFVNGVLDAILKQLNEEERIKKTGRGLVDFQKNASS
ncbi:MAG: transcription antitermination factor NusB [Bacteroidota bacterium]